MRNRIATLGSTAIALAALTGATVSHTNHVTKVANEQAQATRAEHARKVAADRLEAQAKAEAAAAAAKAKTTPTPSARFIK